MTQEDVAADVDIERSYVSQIEIGQRMPSLSVQKRLARTLGTTLDDLLAAAGHRDDPGPPPARSVVEIARELLATLEARHSQTSTELATPSVGNATDIREGTIILVAPLEGSAMWAGATTMEPTIPYVLGPGESGHHFRALMVTGACMEDEIRQGDLVIFDLDAIPKPGEIVVALVDEQILVKRLKQTNGETWLVPNSDLPSVLVTEQVKILGVVRWSARRH